MTPNNFREKANFIWQVADDILRGAFKAHEYGDVILPFVVLRRLDLVLEPQKDAVIKQFDEFKESLDDGRLTPILRQAAGGINFYNHSFYDLRRLAQDSKNIELNFNNYLNGYSRNVREIIENFQLEKIITKLVKNDLLYQLVELFTEVDLSPRNVTNHEMGYIFEELLRRFSEMSNETAGEHYTPREVIRLMVSLMFAEHKDELKGKGIIRTVFDPACGTGGMLITAKEYIKNEINPDVEVVMYGQEINEQTYAIAKSDVLIMGENAENIRSQSSFSKDQFKGQRFSYMLSNPPFGVSWVKEENFIKNEANDPHGRFHAGTPRTSDGALLFLQHMISKMEAGAPSGHSGSRIAIIFNGSPLFTGDAGGGESNIRKWIIENDWLEAVIAMPTEMFYNTGIATYIWMVTNRKPTHRKGKVQLINALEFAAPMKKSLGNKRQYFTDEHIQRITNIYTDFAESKVSKILDNEDFGYTKVAVERPTYNAKGKIETDKQGQPKSDSSLRDFEKVPLKVDIDAYFEREVKPHVPDAWMDRSKDKVGYEISFTKYFYEYQALRSLDEIKADILKLEAETEGLLDGILEQGQHTALINHAVTRGLNPDAPMKDSGVEWLGEIPSHWKAMKIAYFVDKITNGYVGPTRDILIDQGVRYIQSLHIKKNTIDFHKPYYVSQEWSNQHSRTILRENDVLVVQTGAIGEVGIVPKEFDGANCHALIILRVKENLGYGKFLLYALTSEYGYHSMLSIMTGALHPHLNTTYLRDVYLAIPPKDEQREIIEYIEKKTQEIDLLNQKYNDTISLLKEYRGALMSEVMTGKISVREFSKQ